MEKEYTTKYLQINRGKPILFEANEIPSLRTPPELSDLTQSKRVEDEFRSKYPDLQFSKGCLVDGAIMIQNVKSTNNMQIIDELKNLNTTTAITLQVLNTEDLSSTLSAVIQENTSPNNETLFVFPGNGSKDVFVNLSNSLNRQIGSATVFLPTNRTMIRPGKFTLNVDYATLPNKNFTKAVLIDDVVASGQTSSTIAYALKSFYPGIEVSVGTWMMLPPTETNMRSPSGIANVDTVYSSLVLKGNYTSRPPINSLSTFLESSQISSEKVLVYSNKYVVDTNEFTTIMERIRRIL